MSEEESVFHYRLSGVLADYKGEKLKRVPNTVNSGNCHKVLMREHLIDAGILASGYLKMAGSSGDVNLYDLLMAYCLDLGKRAEINAIVCRK